MQEKPYTSGSRVWRNANPPTPSGQKSHQEDHDGNMEEARKAGDLKDATFREDLAREAAKQGGFEANLLTAGEKAAIC
jgi:hypothetical protein